MLVRWSKTRVVLFPLLAFGVCLLQYSLLIPSPSPRIEDSVHASTLAVTKTISQRQTTPLLWMDPWVERIARPFLPFNGTEWCHIDHRQSMTIQQPAHKTTTRSSRSQPLKGLMLTKVHKAGSTTAAGVTLSIAHRVAQRRQRQQRQQQQQQQQRQRTNISLPNTTRPMCHSHFYHEFAIHNHHSHRNVATSFLWTTVRLPHTRAESAYSYYQSPERYHVDEEHMQFLSLSRGHQLRLIRKRSERLVGFYGQLYLHGTSTVNVSSRYSGQNHSSMGIPDNSIITTNPEHLALEHVRREVLDYYNFVAVTERWVESMAVLKLLLPGVRYSDLIVLRTKERGSFVPHGHSCKFIPVVSSLPDRIQTYMDGPFRDTNPDYLLYAAVNRSLDMTIETLGRDRVQDGMRQIQYLQSLAQESCLNTTIQPCSRTGKLQMAACYVRDFGCGYTCIGDVLPRQDQDETRLEIH